MYYSLLIWFPAICISYRSKNKFLRWILHPLDSSFLYVTRFTQIINLLNLFLYLCYFLHCVNNITHIICCNRHLQKCRNYYLHLLDFPTLRILMYASLMHIWNNVHYRQLCFMSLVLLNKPLSNSCTVINILQTGQYTF